MEGEKSLCVMIPVHKPELTREEKVSLNACKKELTRYDCYLVYPFGMEIKAYTDSFKELKLKPVNSKWLASVEEYNKMKLNRSFYNMFNSYKYLLTYELDAYIFHASFDELNVFEYDFIGAPFFKGYLDAPFDAPFTTGCNSGFSIRNIQSCLSILGSMRKYTFEWLAYKYFFSVFPKVAFQLNRITKDRFGNLLTPKLAFYFSDEHVNEDVVWTQIVPQLFPVFRVADHLSALKFSFEHNPERLFYLNHWCLPIGCHAWYKYRDFWKQHIDY
jgi:hypothetical protein